LFWHGRNVLFKLLGDAIVTTEIAENLFSFWGSSLDAGGEGLHLGPFVPQCLAL